MPWSRRSRWIGTWRSLGRWGGWRIPYGCSKGAADQYVLDYAKTYGVRSVVVDLEIDGFAHLTAVILFGADKKITQVHMHQALPQGPDSTWPGS